MNQNFLQCPPLLYIYESLCTIGITTLYSTAYENLTLFQPFSCVVSHLQETALCRGPFGRIPPRFFKPSKLLKLPFRISTTCTPCSTTKIKFPFIQNHKLQGFPRRVHACLICGRRIEDLCIHKEADNTRRFIC